MNTIRIAVSLKGYNEKPNKNEYGRIQMINRIITIDELEYLLSKGHLFCQWLNKDYFTLKDKSIKNISTVSFIPLDIDEGCSLSFEEMKERLTGLDCLLYPTFSYNEEKKIYKYRILFVLDKVLERKNMKIEEFKREYKELYEQAVNIIKERIAEIVFDDSMINLNQAIWGTDKIVINIMVISIYKLIILLILKLII